MLARRDQWLGRDWEGRLGRESIEGAFRAERARLMERARALFPAGAVPPLCGLLAYATGELRRMGLASRILDCSGLAALPAADETGSPAWRGVGAFLLTTGGDWRTAMTKATGFPARKDGGREGAKEEFASLVGALEGVDGLRQALADLARMPPADFDDAQWDALSAVVAVLPVAAAQLLVVFAERGEVDHAQIAPGAVHALGDETSPTDLLLALDYRMSHMLVDEFQDTSLSQYELLATLTAGWEPGDGRTRLRGGRPDAVDLPLPRGGGGPLPARAARGHAERAASSRCTLSTNFRSQAGIVDWVNAAFRDVLPAARGRSRRAR